MAYRKRKSAGRVKAKKLKAIPPKPAKEECSKIPQSRKSEAECPFLRYPTATERLESLGIDSLCDMYVDGWSLRSLARWMDMSACFILKWLKQDEARHKLYQEARVHQAEMAAELTLEVANEPVGRLSTGALDNAEVNNKRLRVDTLKWIAAKRDKRAYGEHLSLNDETPRELTSEQLLSRVAFLLGKANLAVIADVGGGSATQPGQIK